MMKPQWRDGALAAIGEEPIRFYQIGSSAFFERFQSTGTALSRDAMQQLMARFSIRNSKVLSLGPGDCSQEYWLTGNDNQLFLVDIDESGSIELILQALQEKDRPEGPKVTYAIGDARRFAEYGNYPLDVLVSFSFTPDEFHRNNAINAIETDPARRWGWAPGEQTFSSIIIDVCKSLPANGLFVSLSYTGGPAPGNSLSYLPSVCETFGRIGMRLLEVYALRASPAVHLIVAEKLPGRPDRIDRSISPLSAIHPRSHIGTDAVLVYSAMEPKAPTDAMDVAGRIAIEIAEVAAPRTDGTTVRRCIFHSTADSEAAGLLQAGFALEIPSPISLAPFRRFADDPETCFVTRSQLHEDADLLWLGNDEGDEMLRRRALRYLADGNFPARWIFSEATHELLGHLGPDGVVVVYGHAGMEADGVPQFRQQLARELREHGISLRSLHALRIASGIFLAIGGKGESAGLPASVTRFYPSAEDSSSVPLDLSNVPEMLNETNVSPGETAAFAGGRNAASDRHDVSLRLRTVTRKLLARLGI